MSMCNHKKRGHLVNINIDKKQMLPFYITN